MSLTDRGAEEDSADISDISDREHIPSPQALLSSQRWQPQLCSQDLQALKAASGLTSTGYVLESWKRQLCLLGLLRVGTDSPASLSHQALPAEASPCLLRKAGGEA